LLIKMEEEKSDNSYKDFLTLPPASLKAARELFRSTVLSSIQMDLKVPAYSIVKDLQLMREKYEDGILILHSLSCPEGMDDVVQTSLQLLLIGLKRHVMLQDSLVSLPDDSLGLAFDPAKILKQEIFESDGAKEDLDDMTKLEDDDFGDHLGIPDAYHYGNIGDFGYPFDPNDPSHVAERIKLEAGDMYHQDYLEEPEEPPIKRRKKRSDLGVKKVKKIKIKKEQSTEASESDPNQPKVKKKRNRVVKISYTCEYCQEGFSCKSKYVEHVRKHTGERPFKCDQCPKDFAVKGNLTGHLLTHLADKPWPCEFCSKKFCRKMDLEIHMRSHTGEKPYKCEFCFKEISTAGNLAKHRRMHTGEKLHVCDICNKALSSMEGLREHIRTHTGEKPYQCPVCSSKFSRKNHMRRHLKMHTGVKPYRCEICEKTFTRKENLREHMNVHNKIKDEATSAQETFLGIPRLLEEEKNVLMGDLLRAHKDDESTMG